MGAIAIKGYKILQKIGEGGLAEIYKAQQISLDRTVAIKVLKAIDARDPDTVVQFKAEANAVAHLKHNNIVQVYEAGEQKGTHYFIMEYVGGESIADRMKRKGRLDEEQALLIIESVAVALEYAWKKAGLIHCDIKPSNVLVDSDGTIKLSDFSGMTREGLGEGAAEPPSMILGTPAYMAPEQARGEGALDCRADIYGLGALFYHLVTGIQPFDGKDGREIMDCQLSDFIMNPRTLNSKLSLGGAQLIERMMAKNPEQRPADWKEVLSELHRVEKGQMPAKGIARDMVSTVKHAGPYEDEMSQQEKAPAQPFQVKPAGASAGAPPRPPIGGPLLKAVRKLAAAAIIMALLAAVAYALFKHRCEDDSVTCRLLERIRTTLHIPEPREEPQIVETDESAEPDMDEPEPEPEPSYTRTEPDMTEPEPEPEEDVETPEERRRRAQHLVEYAAVMSDAFRAARALELDRALDILRQWQMKNIGHPHWDQVTLEKERLSIAEEALQSLGRNMDNIKGMRLENVGPLRVSGEIVNIVDNDVMLAQQLGEGQATMGVALTDLPPSDFARLFRNADEKNYERNMAGLLIARGAFKAATDFIAKAEAKGQDVVDLVNWMEDWQFSRMNSRALDALGSIRELAESGKPAEAQRQLESAKRLFAGTDIFSWAQNSKIAKLETDIEAMIARQGEEEIAAEDEAADAPSELLAEMNSAPHVSVTDLERNMSQYDGDMVRLRLTHRNRINPSSESTYVTELMGADGKINARFDSAGYRWVRTIPIFDTGKSDFYVFAKVNGSENIVEIQGMIEQTESGDEQRVW